MYCVRGLLEDEKMPFFLKTDEMMNYFIRIRNEVVTNVLFFYSNRKTEFDEKCKYINKNHFVKFFTSHVSYIYDYIYSTLINKRIEPMNSYWTATYVLIKTEKYTLFESYDFITDPFDNIEHSFNDTCDSVDSVILDNSSWIEGMVKMKIGDNYIFRRFDKSNSNFTEFKDPAVSCKARFLNIEYTHPLMKRSIEFYLDKDVYFVDNQILSPTFVKLYLESQPTEYIFDMDYVIKIMDDNIIWFDLKFDKSVLLTENGYLII